MGSGGIGGRSQFDHGFDLHVPLLQLPLVVLLEHTAPISRMIAASLGKMPTTSARRLTSLLSRSNGLVLCNLLRCCSGEIEIGQHLGLAVVDEGGELWPFRAQLVSDMPQHGARLGPIWLQKGLAKGLAKRRGNHALLGLGDISESIAHPVHPAALPAGAEHPANRRFEPLMGIGNDQLDTVQAAPRQAFEKAQPKGFGLRRADMQANNLAPTVGVGGDSDDCRDRHDAAALALLQVGGVEPEIRPLAGKRSVEEGVHALIDLPRLREGRLCTVWKPATC
jgi:hypothetical protein